MRTTVQITSVYYGDGTMGLLRRGDVLPVRRPDGSPLRPGDLRPGQPVRIDEGGRLEALGNRRQRRAQVAARRRGA